MKKLVVLFIALLAMSFTPLKNANGVKLVKSGIDSADVENFDVLLDKPAPVYYDIAVRLDSVDAPSATVRLLAKKFEFDAYTALDTVTWAGTADTTFYWSENTTATFYNFFNVEVKCTDGELNASVNYVIKQ